MLGLKPEPKQGKRGAENKKNIGFVALVADPTLLKLKTLQNKIFSKLKQARLGSAPLLSINQFLYRHHQTAFLPAEILAQEGPEGV